MTTDAMPSCSLIRKRWHTIASRKALVVVVAAYAVSIHDGEPLDKGARLLRVILVLSMLSFAAVAQPVASTESDSSRGYDAIKEVFIPQRSKVDTNHCDISVLLDYDKYLTNMNVFRDEWFYQDKSVEYYQRRGYKLLFIVDRKFATLVTQSFYGTPDSPRPTLCRFTVRASDQDEYGNDRPYLLLSWRFTRDLGNKTRWDRLDDRNFPKLALDFKWGPEFLKRADNDPPM